MLTMAIRQDTRRPALARLEDLTRGALVRGIVPNAAVHVVDAEWHGPDVVDVTYKDAAGARAGVLLFRSREAELEIVVEGRPWSFDSDANAFKLAAEAKRISLGYLFDPYLAVATADIRVLPHQITAVYDEMLPRQPLRFLLADDPGAGKTIMTGLLIRELMVRGALKRCLVVSPGSLVEQWQTELAEKFDLRFDLADSGGRRNDRCQHSGGRLVLERLERSPDQKRGDLAEADALEGDRRGVVEDACVQTLVAPHPT